LIPSTKNENVAQVTSEKIYKKVLAFVNSSGSEGIGTISFPPIESYLGYFGSGFLNSTAHHLRYTGITTIVVYRCTR